MGIAKNAPRCNALGKQKKRAFTDLFPLAQRIDGAYLETTVDDDGFIDYKLNQWEERFGEGKVIKEVLEDGKVNIKVNCACNRPAYKANGKCYMHGGKSSKVKSEELRKALAKAGTKHGALAKKVAVNPEGIMYCEFCRVTNCIKRVETGDCWYEREISARSWDGYERDLGELTQADKQLITELIGLLIKKFRYNKYLNFKDLIEEKVWVHPKTGKPVAYDKLAVGLSQMMELTPQILNIMRELKATRAIRDPEPERHEFIFQLGKKEELSYPDDWDKYGEDNEEDIIDVDTKLLRDSEGKEREVKIKIKKKKDDDEIVWT